MAGRSPRAEAHDVFHVIGDPTRRALIELLATQGELRPKLLAKLMQRSRPALQRHLGVLVRASLVTRRAIGRRSWYGLDLRALAEVKAWLERVRSANAATRAKKRPPRSR